MTPVLALDIGGTKLAAAVVTEDGKAHGHIVRPTQREQGWLAVVRRLFDMGRHAIEEARLGDVKAVGIACGGPLDAASGTLLSPPHLPGWLDVPIGPLAAEAFGVPFALQNDASVGALAEHRFGAGAGVATMLYLTVSTGIGGGAIVNGSPLLGSAGNGAEFGHVTVRRGGRLCGCGRHGCVEAYSSGSAIASRVHESGLSGVTCADVAGAANAGDRVAGQVWAEAMDLLGAAVTDLVNVFEPEVVVLGGGVTRAGALLFDPVREVVAREAITLAGRAVRIVPARLGELVCVVGAGIIGHDRVKGDPMSDWLRAQISDHVQTAQATAELADRIRSVGELFCETFARGGVVYTFGNGGSAADAQHLTGELIGRYKRDRRPLPSVTLSTDTSVLTCIANDYSCDDVFARQVQALARPGDLVVAFTTSGRSPNAVAALAAAREKGATTLLFAAGDGGPAAAHADRALLVPSAVTARIQEMHTLMLHVISEMVDAWAAGEEPQA